MKRAPSESKAPLGADDIRSQLSDIQKRLFNVNSRKTPLKSRTNERSPAEASHLLKHRASSGDFHSRPNDASGGSEQRDRVLDSPGKHMVPQPTPSLGPEIKGNDMNFVVGLSENLLTECRRLTADNSRYKSKLKATLDELTHYKDQVALLQSSRSVQMGAEDDLKNKNWELEAMLQTTTETLTQERAEKLKLERVMKEQTMRLTAVQKENDDLQVEKSDIKTEMTKLRATYEKELGELHATVEELNDENDQLHIKLKESASAVAVAAAAAAATTVAPSKGSDLKESSPVLAVDQPSFDDFELEDLDGLLHDTVDKKPSADMALDAETLQASLAHSHRNNARLRSAIAKLRHDIKDDSKTQTPIKNKRKGKKDTSNITINTPLSAPSNRNSTFLSPSKRSSRYTVLDDEEGSNWEDFIGDNIASPSKAARAENLAATVPALDNSDGSDSEIEDLVAKAEVISGRKLIEEYAKDHNLVLVPADKYEKMLEETQKDHLSISDDKLNSIAAERGFSLMSKKDHNELLDEAIMKEKLEKLGFVTLTSKEHVELLDKSASFRNPSKEYLKTSASVQGYDLIECDILDKYEKSFQKYQKPSKNYLLSKLLEEYQMAAVATDVLEKLKQIEIEHEKPPKSYITAKANLLGLIVSPTKFYDELVKMAYKPEIDHIRERAQDNGMVVLSLDEHREVHRLAYEPTMEEIEARLHPGHTILSSQALETYENPSIDELKKKLEDKGYVAMAIDKLSELMSPDSKKLKELAATHNMVLLTKDEHAHLASPDLDHIKATALDKHQHAVVPQKDYDQLLQWAHAPSLSRVKSKAEGHGLVSLSQTEYTDLYKRANHQPSRAEISELCHSLKLECIPKSEYEQLIAMTTLPTEAYVREAAAKSKESLVVLKETDYTKLLLPSIDALRLHADKLNFVLVEQTELDNLRAQIESPSEEYLHLKVGLHELEILSAKELHQLKNPSKNVVMESAKIYGLTAVPSNDLLEIEKLAHSPNIEHVVTKAKGHGLVTMKQEDHDSLVELAQSPSVEHVKLKAKSHGLVTLADDEHASLVSLAQAPTHEHIVSKAKDLGLVTLSKAELSELQRKALEPSDAELQSSASEKGYTLVLKSEHASLLEKAESPSVKHLEEKAKARDHTVVSTEKYKQLEDVNESPSVEHIVVKASLHGLATVPESELSDLKAKATTPSLDFLREKAARLEQKVIPALEYELLSQLAHSPSVEHLRETAGKVGMVVLPESEHSELTKLAHSPSLQNIKDKAAKHGQLVIEEDEFKNLSDLAHNPTVDHIENKAKVHNLVAVNVDEHKKLSELAHSPTTDHVEQKAKDLGLVTLNTSEFNKLNALAYTPSADHIRECGKGHKLVVLDEDDHHKLRELAHSPSVDHINERAKTHGLVTIDSGKHKTLVELAHSPSKDHITDVAAKRGLVVLGNDDHKSLTELAHAPSMEHINEKAKSYGFTTLRKEDLKSLTDLAHTPSNDHIRNVAAKRKLVVLSSDEHKNLTELAHSPSVDHINERAKSLGLVTVETEKYKTLGELAHSPSEDHVREMATKRELVVLGNAEHKNLTELAHSPSADHVVEKASAHGLVTMDSQEHQELVNLAHEPSVDHITEKAKMHGLVTLDTDEHMKLNELAHSPPISHIKEKALSAGLVPMEKDEHEHLHVLAHKPPKSHILDIVSKAGLLAMSPDEVNNMRNPSMEELSKAASKRDSLVIKKDEHQRLRAIDEQPTIDWMSDKLAHANLLVIPEAEMNRLRETADSPSLDFIKEHAMKADKVVVPRDSYAQLLQDIKRPSLDYLKEKSALIYDHVIILKKEYEALLHPTKESLVDGASKLDLALIGKRELELLKSEHKDLSKFVHDEKNAPVEPTQSHDEPSLVQRAREAGMGLIAIEELSDLKSKVEQPALDFLKEKVISYNHVVLPRNDFDEMKKSASKTLEAQAEDVGKVLIDINELQSLKTTIESPSVEFLSSKAKTLESVVISKSDIDALEAKSNRTISDLIKEDGDNQILVPVSEYETLKNPGITEIQKEADKIGYAIVGKNELEALHSPSLEQLKSNVSLHKHVAVPQSEYLTLIESFAELIEEKASKNKLKLVKEEVLEKLQNPTLEEIKRLAESKHHAIIPATELEQLKTPSIQALSVHAKSHNHVLIPEDEVNLLRNPSLDALQTLADGHSHKLIHKNELSDLKAPNLEKIGTQARLHAQSLVPSSELEQLRKPSLDQIRLQADAHKHSVVQNSDLEALKSPSLAKLADHAAAHEHVLLKTRDAEELRNPSLDVLRSYLDKHEHALISKSELELLREPSQDDLRLQAERRDHALVPTATLSELKQPGLEQVRAHADHHHHVVISKQDHDDLMKSASESLDDKAKAASMIIMTQAERLALLHQVESPTFEYLQAGARKFDAVIIPAADVEQLKQKASQSIEEMAKAQSSIVVPLAEYGELTSKATEGLEERASRDGKTVLDKAEYQNLLCTVDAATTLPVVKANAAKLGQNVVPVEDLARLKQAAAEPLESKAQKNGMKVLSMSAFAALSVPSLVNIKEHASAHKHAVVEQKQWDDLQAAYARLAASLEGHRLVSDAQYKELTSSPGQEKLKEYAQKAGLVLVSTERLNDLEKSLDDRAKDAGKILLAVEEYEQLRKGPSIEEITSLAAAQDYIVLSEAQISDLNNAKSKVDNGVVLDRSEYERLQNLKTTVDSNMLISFAEYDALKDCEQKVNVGKLITSEEYESLKDSERQIRDNRLVSIEEYNALKECEHRLNNGKLITDEEFIAYNELKSKLDNGVLISPPEYESFQTMATEVSKGKLLLADEYDDLLLKANKPTLDHLQHHLRNYGFMLIPVERHEELEATAGKSLADHASESGHVVMTGKEYAEITAAKPITVDVVAENANKLGLRLISPEEADETLEIKAKKQGLVLIPEVAYQTMVKAPKSIEEMTMRLQSEGFVVVSKESYDDLVPTTSPNEFADAEASFVLTREELVASASRLGLVVVPEAEDHNQNAQPAVSQEEYTSMRQQLAQQASELYALKNEKDDPITKELIVEKLGEFDLVALTREEYTALREAKKLFTTNTVAPVSSKADLEHKSSELGLTLLPESEFIALTKALQALESKEAISEVAAKLGLICVPQTAFVATNVLKEPETEKVTLIPNSYYAKLCKGEQLNVERLSDEQFKVYAEKRGYRHNDAAALSPPAASSSVTPVTGRSPDLSQPSKFTPPQQSSSAKLRTPQSGSGSSGGDGRHLSMMNFPTLGSKVSLHSRASISDSFHTTAAFSMATNVSLTDKAMIPAITQVVIGEYLFKYYRRLGPLSSISETRHERYFWVHPYSMTLYWSTLNPVLGNPEDVRTRAAAILGVESVDDNNPLPPGLFHKSIVVHSQNKSVKFTCATRQRHNIWYNALRYMLNRNLEELSFDPDETMEQAEQHNTMDSSRVNAFDGLHRKPKHDGMYDTGDRQALPRAQSMLLKKLASQGRLSSRLSTLRKH